MFAYCSIFLLNLLTIPLARTSRKYYLMINGLFIWLLMSFRSFSVGSDTLNYVRIYSEAPSDIIPNNFVNWFFPANGARFENGFMVLMKALAHISPNPRFMLCVTSAIFVFCVIFFILRLNLNAVVGVLCFESLGFMGFFMSGLRQGLACSFCMVAFVYATEKKPWKFLLFTYLALSMHVSAAAFLVVYAFNWLKNNWKRNSILIVGMGLFLIFFNTIFAKVAENSAEMSNFQANQSNSGGALNVSLSITVIIILLILSRFYLKNINEQSLRLANYSLIFAVLFLLISLHSTQISRVALYFEMAEVICISNIFQKAMHEKKHFSCAFIIVLVIAYFVVVQTLRPEWVGIVPYSF